MFPARAPSSEGELTLAQAGLGVGTGDGRSAGVQAGYQLACLATTLAIAIIGGLITGELHVYHSAMGWQEHQKHSYLWVVGASMSCVRHTVLGNLLQTEKQLFFAIEG